MKHPTIPDIAQRAGVTRSAVSCPPDGQPGVSAVTRERVLAIAGAVGHQPGGAARALTAGGQPGSYAETAPVPRERMSSGPAPVSRAGTAGGEPESLAGQGSAGGWARRAPSAGR